jgi:hypothetical protein
MATLTTDFIKVAQAGPALDGRTIREEWLRDMAEIYDPAVYTAMLWPEHMRWFGQLGEVTALRAGPDERGRFSLFARLKPNKRLLEWNAEGQGLFYSIEVKEDLKACPGKTYLGGLGVTDSPASLGLESTRFSNLPFEPSALTPASPQQDDEPPGWFKKHLPFLFNQNSGGAASEPKDETMPEEQTTEDRLKALEDSQAALVERVGAIEARLTTAEADIDELEKDDDTGSDGSDYKALTAEISGMRTELAAAFSTMKPGTTPPASIGPAQGKKLL